jgi:hypothetical protein
MERNVCTWQERGKYCSVDENEADRFSDGNIRYFEYENDKFEFLSEYKSGDPQRGLAFVPRRGINVSWSQTGNWACSNIFRSTRTKS